ncbi:hypothetical protein AB1N83_012939, partial [Pleurotus pulmonarius]
MSSNPPTNADLDALVREGPDVISRKGLLKDRVTCSHDRGGRIIVISADGTANKFGENSTNVVEFHSRIVKNKKQITFYISGIGTHNPSPVGRVLDMAFANSFETNILIVYKWLAENYEEGDRIFMFGFSRGAYQVRVIAGMIERVGLIYPGSTAQLPDVFKLYMATTERSTNVKTGNAMSRSILWASGRASLPETVSGMSHVCHFRHALALDERRVRLWPEHAHAKSPTGHLMPPGDVKEVWFAGSHSDIGGVTRIPHLGAPRRIQKGQYVHESVFTLMGLAEAKTEPNEAPAQMTTPLHQVALLATTIPSGLRQSSSPLTEAQGTSKYYVQLICLHASGILQGSYASHEGRPIPAVAIPATAKMLSAFSEEVVVRSDGHEQSIDIGNQWCISFQADGSRFATGDDDGTVKIWDIETGKELRTFEGHSDRIRSLAFSPDGRKIAAGSRDGTIRVWDTETGQDLFGAMEGHTNYVTGLAFSPDGTRLASGSYDKTVRLWDEAGKSK